MSDLREGWNFHGDVAMELESIARDYFGFSTETIQGTGFYGGDVGIDNFVNLMIDLLKQKLKRDNVYDGRVNVFIDKCCEYIGTKAKEIDNEIANELICEFKFLMGEDA